MKATLSHLSRDQKSQSSSPRSSRPSTWPSGPFLSRFYLFGPSWAAALLPHEARPSGPREALQTLELCPSAPSTPIQPRRTLWSRRDFLRTYCVPLFTFRS